jgi:hypothetical protein
MRKITLLFLLLTFAGCSQFVARKFDVSQLRDERAADLDDRLSKQPDSVVSPFSSAK